MLRRKNYYLLAICTMAGSCMVKLAEGFVVARIVVWAGLSAGLLKGRKYFFALYLRILLQIPWNSDNVFCNMVILITSIDDNTLCNAQVRICFSEGVNAANIIFTYCCCSLYFDGIKNAIDFN